MSNVKWTVYSHPKNADLKVIVGYAALSSRASSIMTMIPLYDLRDSDYDGSVGFAETIWPFIPLIGGALEPMAEAELMITIGMDMHDPEFVQAARMKALGTAFATADKAFRKNTLLPLLTGPAEAALGAFKLATIANYILKKGFETVVERLLGV